MDGPASTGREPEGRSPLIPWAGEVTAPVGLRSPNRRDALAVWSCRIEPYEPVSRHAPHDLVVSPSREGVGREEQPIQGHGRARLPLELGKRIRARRQCPLTRGDGDRSRQRRTPHRGSLDRTGGVLTCTGRSQQAERAHTDDGARSFHAHAMRGYPAEKGCPPSVQQRGARTCHLRTLPRRETPRSGAGNLPAAIAAGWDHQQTRVSQGWTHPARKAGVAGNPRPDGPAGPGLGEAPEPCSFAGRLAPILHLG